jgi:dipeptidyl aminopeptidase/acylaminoacyl peptidase
MKHLMLILVLSISFFACSDNTQQNDSKLIEFKGRSIDLRPYFDGFPYSGFLPFFKAGKIYYNEIGKTNELKEIDLKANVDLTKGKTISDIDFSLRNVWGKKYNKNDGKLYWNGDEKNDEVLNLYSLDPATKKLEKLTDVPYIFGWQWNDEDKIAYVARLGVKDDRLGELRILDLKTGKEEKILQDTEEFRYTWGTPGWRPDGSGIVATVNKDANRVLGNMVYVDLEKKSWKLLTDPSKGRYYPAPAYKEWLNNDEFIYYSNEDDFQNLYVYNLNQMKSTQLTKFTRDISSSDLITIDGEKYIFAVVSNPIENDIFLIDPDNGKIINSQKVDLNVSILDSEENKMLVRVSSATVKFRIDELTITTDSFSFTPFLEIPKDVNDKIVYSTVERVEFPTFDIDPATGKTRMLHGFLYHPKNPLPKEEQMVAIKSFYGGSNNYRTQNQILAQAGIYVFSPSPRGSSGFGREFSELNDKDLGGNEIIDVKYAAKYISEKLDIPSSRIGTYGGSHGGYATMRLLTFPGEINGNKASFDWGFGMSHAGFSDIVHFYENCNIPDWVTKEAGDPKTEKAKLDDRSPIYHADKAIGKLLLTHGTNDSRVPVEGSLWMADSLKKYGKDFKLVTFEGQGHGIKGLDNSITFYRTWMEFLDEIN